MDPVLCRLGRSARLGDDDVRFFHLRPSYPLYTASQMDGVVDRRSISLPAAPGGVPVGRRWLAGSSARRRALLAQSSHTFEQWRLLV